MAKYIARYVSWRALHRVLELVIFNLLSCRFHLALTSAGGLEAASEAGLLLKGLNVVCVFAWVASREYLKFFVLFKFAATSCKGPYWIVGAFADDA